MVIVLLMGNLGAEPETRFTASGQKVTTLRVASNSKKQGKDETTWYRVTIFGDRYDKMLPYLKKGSGVIVTGELTSELWTDKEGRQHIQHNVIADSVKFPPFGRSDRQQEQTSQSAATPSYASPSYAPAPEARSYAMPSYTPPQPQPQQPFAPQLHDFSFGDIPAESPMHSGQNDDTPF